MKGKENLIKSPKYVIHLFGDICYAASSNLQNILHVLKISGCMMRSAVTNGSVQLGDFTVYQMKCVSICGPRFVIAIYLQNNRGD